MRNYNVGFNFYDETQGQFDTASFNVEAENQFQARRMAWSLCENNERYPFMSKLQISGVSWESNPMDMQDYFNSKASRLKSFISDIENVEKPNLYIRLLTGNSDFNKESYDYEIVCKDREIANYYGAIGAIDKISQDFGQAHGIVPPSIFEELHFANHLLDSIESGNYAKYEQFSTTIINAQKWVQHSMDKIKELFEKGYMELNNETELFNKHFSKEGIFQKYNDVEDNKTYTYTSRFRNVPQRTELEKLPLYNEKDVIANSEKFDYGFSYLVLKKETLPIEKQTPENIIWVALDQKEDYNFEDKTLPLEVENAITGEISSFKGTDFHGVIKPEILIGIDFSSLEKDYERKFQATSAENKTEELENEDDLEQ